MFGVLDMGNKDEIVSLTKGQKLKLPKFCYPEEGDLVALYPSKEGKYYLYNLKDIELVVSDIENQIKSTMDKNQRLILYIKKLKLYRAMVDALVVDKYGNIKLKKEEVGTNFKCTGINKHLVLEKLK